MKLEHLGENMNLNCSQYSGPAAGMEIRREDVFQELKFQYIYTLQKWSILDSYYFSRYFRSAFFTVP